jgi:hypothetical protein
MMKRDFHAKGIAGTDRLNEDGCGALQRSHNDPPKPIAERRSKTSSRPSDIRRTESFWVTGNRVSASRRADAA